MLGTKVHQDGGAYEDRHYSSQRRQATGAALGAPHSLGWITQSKGVRLSFRLGTGR